MGCAIHVPPEQDLPGRLGCEAGLAIAERRARFGGVTVRVGELQRREVCREHGRVGGPLGVVLARLGIVGRDLGVREREHRVVQRRSELVEPPAQNRRGAEAAALGGLAPPRHCRREVALGARVVRVRGAEPARREFAAELLGFAIPADRRGARSTRRSVSDIELSPALIAACARPALAWVVQRPRSASSRNAE